MTRPKHLATLAATALMAATLCACNSGGDGTATATPSVTPSPTSASPSPTLSPEDVAVAAAEKKIPEYFAVSDQSLQDPENFNLEDFKAVAISSALIDLQNRFNVFTAQEFTQEGSANVESMTNPRVDLLLDLTKSPPDVPTVQLDVCVDVSKLNLVNAAGESQVSASRKPRQLWRVGVSNYEYPAPDQWRVSFTDTQGGKTC
jgi:hypothetical protein